jgi:hypothetical protein
MYTSKTASILLLTAAAMAAPTDTVGSVKIFNNCAKNVNFWAGINGNNFSNMQTIPVGGNWAETFDPASVNHKTITLMTTSGGPFVQEPKLIVGYTLAPAQSRVYYDLFTAEGSPSAFEGYRVVQKSAEQSCQGANVWPNGTPLSGQHVFSCMSDRDLLVYLCGGA